MGNRPNNLRKVRKARNISVETAAEAIGKGSVKTLYDYEKGNHSIPSDVLIKLAKLYRTTTDYLLGITPYDTVTVVDSKNNVIASVGNGTSIEQDGYTVIFSVNQYIQHQKRKENQNGVS